VWVSIFLNSPFSSSTRSCVIPVVFMTPERRL
jgi:hypothetical protein